MSGQRTDGLSPEMPGGSAREDAPDIEFVDATKRFGDKAAQMAWEMKRSLSSCPQVRGMGLV